MCPPRLEKYHRKLVLVQSRMPPLDLLYLSWFSEFSARKTPFPGSFCTQDATVGPENRITRLICRKKTLRPTEASDVARRLCGNLGRVDREML